MSQKKKHLALSVMLASIAGLFAVPITYTDQMAFAETDSQSIPEIKVAPHLKKNPLAMKIIAEMEAQKLRYKQQQEQGFSVSVKQVQISPKQTEIEENKMIAKQRLADRLEDLREKYKEFTPKASFARFVDKKPEYTHGVFWGMFDYMQGKVDAGRAAMKEVVDNGGSLREARDAYFEKASTTRVQLIQVTKDLNIQHGLADKDIQDTFDEYGKLPRYDDT